MNYIPNQNGKVLEETPAGSNSDDVKTTLRRLRYFKMTLPSFQFLKISLPIRLLPCYILDRVLRMGL